MNIRSKLPHVGTTIFTVMTNRARELGAINLAQGFPDFDSPAKLKDLLAQYVASGHNQYAPMIGVAGLREQIAQKMAANYGRTLGSGKRDHDHARRDRGDFLGGQCAGASGRRRHPVRPVVRLVCAGGDSRGWAARSIFHCSRRTFASTGSACARAVTPRLRLVMINTPHNPTGSILSAADLDALADLLRPTDALVLSDEVYEHMVYDGERHASIAGHAELSRAVWRCFSFGKTMHATGWRVGYAIAPPELTREIRRVHQFNTFSIATPLAARDR